VDGTIGLSATSQIPQQPGIYRSKCQLTAFGCRASIRNVIKYPSQLGPRKVGVNDQSGVISKQLSLATPLNLIAAMRSASILPDDGGMNGLACFAIPNDGRLSLVGDSNRRHVAGLGASLAKCGASYRQLALPNLPSIVLNPAGLWEMLSEFFLSH
jgi:hypothetical protein